MSHVTHTPNTEICALLLRISSITSLFCTAITKFRFRISAYL